MSEFQHRSDLAVLLLEAEMPTEIRQTSGVLRWMAVWTILSFGPLSCAQQAPTGLYTPSEAEVVVLVKCERTVLGEMGADKRIRSGIYDILYGQWLIVGERADEIIRCLVERHGWIGLSAPDGRRGARAPR
jgi:hypothetical protein